MRDLLPEAVLQSLREHYYAAVMAAEIGYDRNAENENAVTGALGQALFTPDIRIIQVNGQVYGWRAFHEVLSSQGRGTAEREFGADGVFQLELLDRFRTVVRRKALLFQAKKNWNGANKRLLKQAEQMVAYTPSAIVVDYRHAGFSAVGALDVIKAGGNRRHIPPARNKRLGEILGDDFVWCRIGDVGVFWNPETQTLEFENGTRVPRRIVIKHLMTTIVQQL